MTIVKREIESQEIITEFNTKLQSFIIANTAWVGNTGVWNTTVGAVTGNNSGTSKDPGGPALTALKPDISAVQAQANSIRAVVTAWMKIYSRTSRIRLNNTGNLAPASYTGTYRFTLATREVTAVQTGAATLLNTWAINSQGQVNKANINSLINALQSLWTSAARDTTTFTFSYNYCHSSCHSSRGRR
jgi:hypothetical protein